MTLDVFRAKRLYFSAEKFLEDVGRQPRDDDWIYKMDDCAVQDVSGR